MDEALPVVKWSVVGFLSPCSWRVNTAVDFVLIL